MTRLEKIFGSFIIVLILITYSLISHILVVNHVTNENVEASADSLGDVIFYEKTNLQDRYAIGLIINESQSLVFILDKKANITQLEADYVCETSKVQEVFQRILEKGYSEYTKNKIVPCNITQASNNEYHFKYYDGFSINWSFGNAIYYTSNETIQYIDHVRS